MHLRLVSLHIHPFDDGSILRAVRPYELCPEFDFSDVEVYSITSEAPTPHGAHGHHERVEIFRATGGTVTCDFHTQEGCHKVVLDNPDVCVVVPSGVFHAVTIERGATLHVVASHRLREEDHFFEINCVCGNHPKR